MSQPASGDQAANPPPPKNSARPAAVPDVPAAVRSGWKWWVAFGILLVFLVFLAINVEGLLNAMGMSVDAWYGRAAIAFVAILTGMRIFHADREAKENFRGHCRHCGHELCATDRECPGCERTVPREQRMGKEANI